MKKFVIIAILSAILRPLLRNGLRSVVPAVRGMLAMACLVLLQISAGCGGGSGSSGGSPPPPPPPPANPIPAIVSLSPNSADAAGAAFTLTITGYNFMSSSAVQWNGSPRTTTYTSSTQLQAQITAADIGSSGSAGISVTNPSPGGGNSGSAEFTINATSNPAPSVLSLNPSSIAAGSSGLILTLNGSNFMPASTIEWNGAAIPTSYLSDTQLEAQIPVSDLAYPGVADVVVLNPTPGGGTSAPMVFAITYTPMAVSQLANDLVWDATNQVIYLSVPSLASSNGNTVAILNPNTGNIQSSQFAGSEPDVLAISDDDQVLYAALDGSSSVQSFTLPNLQPDINYSLGTDPTFGPYFGVDLQVAPSLPHTTAVSRGIFNVSPVALGGMAIYDDATQRPNIAHTSGPLYDSLQWGSDTAIYAINSEVSSFDFYVLKVNSSGVTQSKDYQNEFADFYVRMHYDSGTGLVYTDDGYVINPANGQSVDAFQASGYMVPDSTLNTAFFFGQTQSQFGTTDFTIESFDLTTFAPIAEIVVPNVQGNPLRFIRWGASGLAFNDDAGFIYLINSSFVGSNASHTKTPQRDLSPVKRSWSKLKAGPKDRVKSQIRSNPAPRLKKGLFSPQDSNPAPAITTLSPTAVAAGEVGLNGFTLTVTGSNFVSLSTVEWNGTQLPTELVSSTELLAQVSLGDVQTAGSVPVDVVTPSPGGGSSNALTFTIVSQPSTTQYPSIISLYPDAVMAGSEGFTLQVNGYWLNQPDTVLWNGTALPPAPNEGILQGLVSATDVATPGYAQVTALTPQGIVTNTAEFQILYQPLTVNQSANDMAWDPVNQVFYISVPSSASTNANQVCVLSTTGTITNCQPGSEPDVLAISDDSQFLYVGMDGTSSVQRFILPGLTPDINYSLGTYFALDLQVAPGAPHTTAVTKGTETDPAATGGITIYDDATPRPTSAPGWPQDLYNSLQWGANATELYAASSDLYTLTVSPSGVVLDKDYPALFWNLSRINYDNTNGLIYSDDGFHVINPSTGLPVGIFEVGGGWPMAPDSTLDTVFILTQYIWQEHSNYTVDLFDMAHFTLINQIPFSTTEDGINPVARFIRWGANGLAANFKGGNVYILSGSFLNGESTRRSETQLKPVRRN